MLISQDRHLIYVTLAEYTQAYVDYLQDPRKPQAYMKMQEYGPFRADNATDMRALADIVVNHTLALRYDIYQKPVDWKASWNMKGPILPCEGGRKNGIAFSLTGEWKPDGNLPALRFASLHRLFPRGRTEAFLMITSSIFLRLTGFH